MTPAEQKSVMEIQNENCSESIKVTKVCDVLNLDPNTYLGRKMAMTQVRREFKQHTTVSSTTRPKNSEQRQVDIDRMRRQEQKRIENQSMDQFYKDLRSAQLDKDDEICREHNKKELIAAGKFKRRSRGSGNRNSTKRPKKRQNKKHILRGSGKSSSRVGYIAPYTYWTNVSRIQSKREIIESALEGVIGAMAAKSRNSETIEDMSEVADEFLSTNTIFMLRTSTIFFFPLGIVMFLPVLHCLHIIKLEEKKMLPNH